MPALDELNTAPAGDPPGDADDPEAPKAPAEPGAEPTRDEEEAPKPAPRRRARRRTIDEPPPKVPDELPILPMRNVVVFPLSFLPLSVGQPRSVRLVEDVMVGSRIIGLFASMDPELQEPPTDKIHTIGTAAYVHRMVKGSDGQIGIFVQGMERVRIEAWLQQDPYLTARVSVLPDPIDASVAVEALRRSVVDQFTRLVELVPHLPEELSQAIQSMDDARALAYFIAANTRMEVPEAQRILGMDSVEERLRALVAILGRELEVLEIGRKIQTEARGEMEKMQREFFLRQQMKAIRKELGEEEDGESELDRLEERILAAGMPEEPQAEALRELARLRNLPDAAAEHGVIRTYLDWMVSLPWNVTTEDDLDIRDAKRVLDEDHYDLEDIKERILEFLAVQKLRRERGAEGASPEIAGGILAFAGPPGTGKTSLGRSIARAMGRKFVRMSLGGLRDEAEIRGHRRTYIGALPGRIIQGLKRAGTRNPVFIMDEIDKVGASFRGDPESALLEVLDPQQNHEFRDLYVDAPFDLSDVLFIATANDLGKISPPLRDRLEIIELSGYTDADKVHIARGFLVPRQNRENGLRDDELSLSDAALAEIAQHYTREAGVRSLERQIGKVARKVAVAIAAGEKTAVAVDFGDVRTYLGARRFFHEAAERTAQCGVATGLAYTAYGGDVLFVEASAAPGGKGFQVTGQLGDVMRESALAALSYVRAHADRLGVEAKFFAEHDLHIHVPAGATPKDGPSAGVTIATALASLLSRRPVRAEIGMTGEITLRGKVLPVGGIKEKVLAAHRAGLTTLLLPRRNEPDLDDVPDEVRSTLTFHLVDDIDEVWRLALEEGAGAGEVVAEGSAEEGAEALATGAEVTDGTVVGRDAAT